MTRRLLLVFLAVPLLAGCDGIKSALSTATPTPEPVAAPRRPPATPRGDWMHDPNRKGPLDQPAKR